MIVLLTSASKTLKDLRCLQSAAAKASSSSALEDDDQQLITNTRVTNSVIGSDNGEEITGKMTQSDKHEQPPESISKPASKEPPPKVRRGRPANTSPQKLLAEVYGEVEVEAEAGLQKHIRLHDNYLLQHIDALQQQYSDVFAEPSGLPPDRGPEHVTCF